MNVVLYRNLDAATLGALAGGATAVISRAWRRLQR